MNTILLITAPEIVCRFETGIKQLVQADDANYIK